MDYTFIFFIISIIVCYAVGLYVGSKLDEKEKNIRWQHAYNRGWDDAMEVNGSKYEKQENSNSETQPEKEYWKLEVDTKTKDVPILCWRSNAQHAQKSHRKTEDRKWMQ